MVAQRDRNPRVRPGSKAQGASVLACQYDGMQLPQGATGSLDADQPERVAICLELLIREISCRTRRDLR